MKPVTLLAVLVVVGILAAFGLARKGPAVKAEGAVAKDEAAGSLDEVDLQGEGGQIKLLEGQVEYLEGQVRVLREENSALLEQLGRLGMKDGGGKMLPGGVGSTEVEPDFVGMGLDLVKLRELEALPTAALPVPAEVIEEKILKWLRARQPEDRGERFGRALHALGLIPEAVDPLPLRAALLVRQLGAWYDAEEGTLLVDEVMLAGGGQSFREALGLSMAQVLREFGERMFPVGQGSALTFDEQLAREAVLAGDAGLTRFLYTLQHPEVQNREELPPEDPDHPFNQVPIPQFLRQTHFFPFAEGFEFMQGLHGAGAFAQMNAAYSRPPKNTAEVLDSEAYLAGRAPLVEKLTMEAVKVVGELPFWEDGLGKYAILTALKAWNEPERAGLGAQGWVADRLLTYPAKDAKQRGHAVWQTLWQDAEWSEAFFRAMAECLRQRYSVPLTGKETGVISFEAQGRFVTLMKNRGGAGVVLVDAGEGELAKELLKVYRGQ